jgi:hypothetical protein
MKVVRTAVDSQVGVLPMRESCKLMPAGCRSTAAALGNCSRDSEAAQANNDGRFLCTQHTKQQHPGYLLQAKRCGSDKRCFKKGEPEQC